MTNRQVARKCHWCGETLYIDQIKVRGNARGYGQYIECEECGNNNVISETDLTREMI